MKWFELFQYQRSFDVRSHWYYLQNRCWPWVEVNRNQVILDLLFKKWLRHKHRMSRMLAVKPESFCVWAGGRYMVTWPAVYIWRAEREKRRRPVAPALASLSNAHHIRQIRLIKIVLCLRILLTYINTFISI